LLSGIDARLLAEKIEEDKISEYEALHGKRPRGNPPKGK
jgi:hypothetical protein